MNESTTFSWTCYYHLQHTSVSCPSSPSYKQATQQKDLPAPNCGVCKHPDASQLAFTARALSRLVLNFLCTRTPDPFLLSCFLVSWTQCAHGVIPFQKQDFELTLIPFSLSVQYRLFGAITTCHKPGNQAKIHPTFAVLVPTLTPPSPYQTSTTAFSNSSKQSGK